MRRRTFIAGLLGALGLKATAWAQPLPPSNLRVGEHMAISVDNTGQSAATVGFLSSVTISSVAVGSGENRLLVVGVSYHEWSANNPVVNSVTFGGTNLTQLQKLVAGQTIVEIWYLKAPANTTADVVVTMSAATYLIAGATSWFGVDQTTTFGTVATANGSSTSPSVAVTSAVDELVHDTLAVNGAPTITVGAGQTQRWNLASGTNKSGAGSTEAGAASVTMSWTLGTSATWSIMGVPLKPAAGAASVVTPRSFALLGVGA